MLANHNENRLSFEAENNGDLPLQTPNQALNALQISCNLDIIYNPTTFRESFHAVVGRQAGR